jgi:hypothetical protein
VVYESVAQSLKVEEPAVSDDVVGVVQGVATGAAQRCWVVQWSESLGIRSGEGVVNCQLEGGGSGPPQEKRTPCLSTPLVFFHCCRCRPQGVVDLGGGLGYHVLICRPVQGEACCADLKVVVSTLEPIVFLPMEECLSVCTVLLVSRGLDAIHAIRQICKAHSTCCGRQVTCHP